MLWLKNLDRCPPGSFYYNQTDGIAKSFESTPLIKELAAKVSDFRKGNKLQRPDYQSCLEDCVTFTVQRLVAQLGPENEWVYVTDKTPSFLLPSQAGSCSGCGAVLTPL